MNDCEYYSELISSMLDGELSGQQCEAVQKHIELCPDCKAMYDAFSALSAALSDGLEDAPDGFAENVMAELRRTEIKKKNSRKAQVKRIIAAAACFVVIAGAVTVFPRVGRAKAAAPEAPMEMPAAADLMIVKGAELAGAAEDGAEVYFEKSKAPETMLSVPAAGPADPADAPQATDAPVPEPEAEPATYRLTPWQFEELGKVVGASKLRGEVSGEPYCRFECDTGESCEIFYDGVALSLRYGVGETHPATCSLAELDAFIETLKTPD